jgi:glycosyltransferase involved in cell wall biosynthesis
MTWLEVFFSFSGLAATAFWLFAAVQAIRMRRMMERFGMSFPDIPPTPPSGQPWPKVSIIVPGRNEEAAFEESIRSFLAQDYSPLEIVAIDDRSTDATAQILERLADAEPRLKVLRVDELPTGWLGKNNANREGARRATGDWLLFTDADVRFGPDTVRRAISFALRHRLGHVVALPRLLTEGFWESSFVSIFCFFFTLKVRLWQLLESRTRASIGSGAFNLVRREDYARCGGHDRLRLEVADDLKLGLLLRRSGTRQGAFDSRGAVRVRWQDGFFASMSGLVKNMFSAMEWRWDIAIGSAVGIAFLSVLPAALLWLAPPTLGAWQVVPVVLAMLLHGIAARSITGGSGLEGLAHPLMAALFIGVILWSAIAATWRDGVDWRGTRYRLADLRAGCVREADFPLGHVVGWEEANDGIESTAAQPPAIEATTRNGSLPRATSSGRRASGGSWDRSSEQA